MKTQSISLLPKRCRRKYYLLEVWNFDISEKVDLLNTYGKDLTPEKLKAGPEYVKADGLYNTIF